MRTIIKLYRTHKEAYAEYSNEAKEMVGEKHFRIAPSRLTYDANSVRHIFACLEEWVVTPLPKGDDVELYLECMLTEEERLMVTRDYYIRS